MDQRPIEQNWGLQQNIAPTQRRTDPYAFITGSLTLGLTVSAISLWILWRPLPLIDLPAGTFGEHVSLASKWLLHQLLPHTFTKDAQAYVAFLASQTLSIKIGMLLRLGASLALGIAPAFFLARTHLKPRDAMMEIRGGHRFELQDGAQQLQRHLSKIPNAIPDLEFGQGVIYPSQLWTQHVLLVGGVGAGKSTFMRPLLSRIVACGDRLLCFDPKGEFTTAFATTAIVAPWDARSYAWDIAKDMRNLGDMERFAAALIQDSQDPMWSNAARGILVGFLVYLKKARGTDWTWQNLADLLSLSEEDILGLMKRYHPEASRSISGGSVTSKGILINLEAFCRPVYHLARAWGETPPERRISFVEWTKGARPTATHAKVASSPARQIMLQGNGAYPELTRAYVQGIFAVVSGIVNSVEMDDDPKRKIWIVADEFAQMGKIPIRPLFEVGRSRGVRCIVACQDFAQLEEVHGKEGTRALISMCGTLMVGRVGPGETAETLSKNLGNREVERSNVSQSFEGKPGSSGPTATLTYSRDSLALYVPAELASRLGEKPAQQGCVFAVSVQGAIFEILWPYVKLPKQRKAHLPALWTLGEEVAQSNPFKGTPVGSSTVTPSETQVETQTGSSPLSRVSWVSRANSDNSLADLANSKPGSDSARRLTNSPVTVVTTMTDTESASGSQTAQKHESDPLDAMRELTASHDPAETAAHLALKAIEMLKVRPGPAQRVVPNPNNGPPASR